MHASSSSFLQPILPTVENLYIIDGYPLRHWPREVEGIELPELLRAVKNLHLSREIVPYIMMALQEVLRERITEALSTLQNRRGGQD